MVFYKKIFLNCDLISNNIYSLYNLFLSLSELKTELIKVTGVAI